MAEQENPDWVRVKDTRTGHEITVSQRVAHKEHYEVLDKVAVDRSGRPLPAKPKVNLEPLSGGGDSTEAAKPSPTEGSNATGRTTATDKTKEANK